MVARHIAISDCKVGYILAEHVQNRFGAIIVAENTVLNSYIIDRLIELGVAKLKIYESFVEKKYDNKSKIFRYLEISYNQSILDIKSIVNELAAGKPLNAARVNSVSAVVYSGIYDSTNLIKILTSAREFDEYTYTHSLNVALYSMLIGRWLGLGEDNIKDIIKAGLLHDIGKIKVPIEVLNKKTRLTDEEFEIIKKHTTYGYELVKSADCFSEEVCNAVLSHHEREDKSGYPFGIGSRKIGMYAKIIAVADVFDAMSSDRIYQRRTAPFGVFEMFQTIGVKNFNLRVVKTFLTNLSTCYIGSKVMLNTGEIGEVVYIPLHNITEPVILVGSTYLDMSKSKDKHILAMV